MSTAPRRTKIIATLGPATDRPGMLDAILREGVDIARINLSRHGVADRVELLHGDLLAEAAGPFQLIVSNPPYVPEGEIARLQPEVRDHEPLTALAAGSDGRLYLAVVAAGAASLVAVDPQTGERSQPLAFSGLSEIQGMALAPGGRSFRLVSESAIYDLDPSTGQATLLATPEGPLRGHLEALAYRLAAVPPALTTLTLKVLDGTGEVVDTLPTAKRRGLSRVTWSMRMPPPRVPTAASAAGGALVGPRLLPGTYTARLSKDQDVLETKLEVRPDPRSTHTVADRKAQFDLAVRLYRLLGDMTDLVDRMNGVRARLDGIASKLPPTDALIARLRSASAAVDEQRKKIVATKEGGMVTGEERLREFMAELYGSVVNYEGRPTASQVQRADVLARELEDVKKEFDAWTSRDLPAIDKQLSQRKIGTISGPR